MIKISALRTILIVTLLLIVVSSSTVSACSTVIAGKKASANGCVMIGHTEDIDPQPAINQHKVERKQYQAGDKVTLRAGGQLDEAAETWAYIWSEVPGEDFCDGYINEWGVTIVSNRCPSKENEADTTDGGIRYMLRQIVAQRAKTSREGVKLAGQLIEKFGYNSTGRTYSICDPNEGWVFCAIRGRHWLAQRVPDDHIAVIANSYSVRAVDLADTVNFLAAPDLVKYAASRGWYNPAVDSVFDFAKIFADTVAAAASYNVCRQWSGLRYVVDDTVAADWGNLPFSLKADRKMDVLDIMEILRHHYENTALYQLPSDTSSPHESQFMTTCSQRSQMTFVAELRKDMPANIGIVYWLSLGKPCYSYLVPFYFGTERFPDVYYTQAEHPDSSTVANMLFGRQLSDLDPVFWKFCNFSQTVDSNFAAYGSTAWAAQAEHDRQSMAVRGEVESSALELYKSDKKAAIARLTLFSEDRLQAALVSMERVLGER